MLNDNVDNQLTEKVIGAFYKVYNALGFGYLEKVYENAMVIELRKAGLKVESQKPIRVYYDNIVVGEYFADLMVEAKLIVEIKSVASISIEHETQLFNYLKSTNTQLGLLMNFGPKAEFRRKIWHAERNPC